jgi:hypothetical protein
MIIKLIPVYDSTVYFADLHTDNLRSFAHSTFKVCFTSLAGNIRYRGNTAWNYCFIDNTLEPAV